ncbi:citrate lyase ligase [Thermosinus carboxydivorans Nor1]|uniref:[Citrate [pro-3S]-lyase] ligase n=1 Tax=Thermosinus carboxydivorans Nor1 TaxID=401526 RepID=A1HQH0_9FIRM|nr:[citrate (pro-3S)-lyase] ligase [Thermosinus carboxydivorans]EAX47776.1 citrate lyase ligase [Thermosinus carboxydivorans Nor1]
MLWADAELRVVNLANVREVAEVRDFLARFGLTFDETVEYTVGLYRHEQLVATGSLAGEVLRNFAVDEALQGEGLAATVVSHLMQEAARRGRYHYFVFTRPGKAHLFASLGFKEIARAEPYAALLEAGIGSIDSYCRELAQAAAALPAGPRAAVVVNCNPFTLGHKAVIAKAAQENAAVVVLVVSEDRSLFPFDVRLRLVREGLADYQNILVLPGGKYIVSAATFPGYFTRGEETVAAQTRLDATIFARYIAPALEVTVRYVGDEPYCPVTRAYNEAMAEILPQYGIAFKVMPRIAVGGTIVSASRVRELIRQDNWEEISKLVPETTYRYLVSPEAAPVIARIRSSHSRH